jgi:DNA-binding GntR family transcriptional regulator
MHASRATREYDHVVADDANFAPSPVVTTVFEQLLGAVQRGELLPGQRISDAELAAQYGVSRTPVREALQRLREIGVIEASASRFTRVADVTPQQTAQAFVVWLALYAPLVEEIIPIATDELVVELEADHAEFTSSVASMDLQAMAGANLAFFSRMPALSSNPALQRAITSVVHVIRLGSLHLPAYIDLNALIRAQEMFIRAARERDLPEAREALVVLRNIQVPTEE